MKGTISRCTRNEEQMSSFEVFLVIKIRFCAAVSNWIPWNWPR